MSRIGKMPITIPDKVEVSINGSTITVKGPLGTLIKTFREEIVVVKEDNILRLTRTSEAKSVRALHGLTRALLSNMVVGVSAGFTKELELVGVGYRAQMKGEDLVLALGYSHPVEVKAPAGIILKVEDTTKVIISGVDKQAVGDIASHIRSKRPPEVYKGKGIKYKGEFIRRKVGKSGKSGKKK